MSFEYYAEYHNYDMLMLAAITQLRSGKAAASDKKQEFSCYSSSMLLSFCALESFLNSIAFLLQKNSYKNFDLTEYENITRVSERLEIIGDCIKINIDKSQGKYQTFINMYKWRNSIVHAKPSSVGVVQIATTSGKNGPPRMPKIIGESPFENFVTFKNAKIFYDAAYDIIEEIKNKTSFDPRAMCSYKAIS